jgi:hypothetical protein
MLDFVQFGRKSIQVGLYSKISQLFRFMNIHGTY